MNDAARTSDIAMRNRAERKYRRLLAAIFKKVDERISGLTEVSEINRALRSIADSPQFHDLCTQAAQQMATMLAVGQKSTWMAAAKASSQGRAIYQALLRETTNTAVGQTISNIALQNAQLIKTVPPKMAREITELVQKRWIEGASTESIVKEIREKATHLEEREARRIARTECSKAATALGRARAEKLGCPFYIWRTTRNSKVRPSHRIMEGVICRWSDPPNPERLAGEKKSYGNYNPGGIFECHCHYEMIVALEDIEFPAKVHIAGSIVTIGSLKGFKTRFDLT